MLKGTTKIELTDINTGETQTIEKHNAITGALQELFNPVLGHLTVEESLQGAIPVHKSLLGGLLLFDSKIEGEPLPVYAPAGVKLIGCARYNNDATQLKFESSYMGSYNATESSITPEDKIVKFVYDFSPSQANGTINAVCLTHNSAGFGVYRSDFAQKYQAKDYLGNTSIKLAHSIYAKLVRNLTYNGEIETKKFDRSTAIVGYNDNTEYLYAVDIDNDEVLYFKLRTSQEIVLLRRRLGLKHYSVFGNYLDIVGEQIIISLANPITGVEGNTRYNTYNFDTKDNALYIISNKKQSATVSSGESFLVTKIELGTGSASQTSITNGTGVSLCITSGYVYDGRVYMAKLGNAVTIDGKSGHSFNIISYSISDTSESALEHGTVNNATSTTTGASKPMYAADGRLYWQGYYNSGMTNGGGLWVTDCSATPDSSNTTLCGVDTLDYAIINSTQYPVSCTPVLNHPMLMYLSYIASSTTHREGFAFLTHYLGTINNLATPITKVDTQSMRITYTIEEV